MRVRGIAAGRSHLLVYAALGVAVAGLVWGLAGAFATSASPPAGKVVLRVGWVNEPDNLNPFIGYSTSSYLVYHLNYDMLTGYKAATVEPAPELAQSWKVSPDGKVWTFQLRPNVKWQDGQPFTSQDVVFTYEYIIRNQLAAYTSYTAGIDRVVAAGPLTVKFYCAKPKANMLGLWVPIVPEHIWSKVDPKAAGNTYQSNPPIIGTGPFQVVEFKKGSFVRMDANPGYWRGRPKIDEIVFSVYRNPDTMVQELKSGSLDACWGVPEAQFAPLGHQSGIKTIDYLVKGFDELGFNCYTGGRSLGNPVLTDWKFRQALNWAVDKQKIVQVAYDGYALPATTIIVQDYYHGVDWHWQPPPDQLYTYDPAKATQMFAAAGYRTAGGKLLDKQGRPITLRLFACDAPPQGDSIAKLLTDYFGAVGIHIKYTLMDEATMNEYLYNTVAGKFVPNFDMYIYNWTGDVDPNFILSVFLTNQINNWSDCAWSDPAYDALFNKQTTTIDPAQRKTYIDQMQQIVYQQSPYVVLTYPKGLEALDTSRWDGWVQSPVGGSAIYSVDNIDTYLFVHPKAASAGTTKRSQWPVAVAVLAAVVIVGLIVWLIVRRRGQAEEEA